MPLRTDYKDDVFTGSRKYSMTTNPDTTVSFIDETEYVQQGDSYGAAQINAQNDLLNDLDSKAYRQTDTAEATISDGDYFPFYDVSASAKRKTLWSTIKSSLSGVITPKAHPSNSAATYGAGNASQFGHVRLSDRYDGSDGAASSSVGASSYAVAQAYANRAPIPHASEATTYGKGTTTKYGHLKITDTYSSNGGDASAGVAASGKAVYNVYASKAKTNHADTETTYGKGTGSKYGHLKISDKYTESAGSASDGVAASSKAVNDAYVTTGLRINGIASDIDTIEGDIDVLENEFTANNKRIYFDYKNGKYGYNTSANRGADTFHPFNQPIAAPVQTSQLAIAEAPASSVTQTLQSSQAYSDATLIASFGGANIGVGTPTINVSNATLVSTLSTMTGGTTFVYRISCAKNFNISLTVSHTELTGGMHSLLIFGIFE